MKHFLVLFLAPVHEREELMKNMAREEMDTIIDSWRRWKTDH